MNRNLGIGLVIVLLLVFCAPFLAAGEEKVLLYLENPLPVSEEWTFPTIVEEGDHLVIKGLSLLNALGVSPDQMTAYDFDRDPISGWYGWHLSKNSDVSGREDQIVLNMTADYMLHGTLMNYFGEEEEEVDWWVLPGTGLSLKNKNSKYREVEIGFDHSKGVIGQDLLSVHFVYEDGTVYTVTADETELYRQGQKWRVGAWYGADGWLKSASVLPKELDKSYPGFYYERLGSLSHRYGLTYVFYAPDVFWHEGNWYNPQTGEAVEPPADFDLNDHPFQVIGDPEPEEENMAQPSEGGLFPALPDEAAVYAIWSGAKELPPLPEIQASETKDGKIRLTVQGLRAWGAREQDMRVWGGSGDVGWETVSDFLGEDTLILETEDENWVYFWMTGGEEEELGIELQYVKSSQYLSIRVSNGLVTAEKISRGGPILRYDYHDLSIASIYNEWGELQEYTIYMMVGDDDFSYTYTYDPTRGATADHPVLENVTITDAETNENCRYYWRQSYGWAKWDDKTGSWVESEVPQYVDRCAPLPLL